MRLPGHERTHLRISQTCCLHSLKSYDAAANGAVVEYKGDQLDIDASLLTGFQFRIDSLYEFIGEIQASADRQGQRANGERGEARNRHVTRMGSGSGERGQAAKKAAAF